MLGASGVQIPENNLDNMKLTREKDREFETLDPQCLLGFEMLEGLDLKILGSLLKSTNFATLVLLRYILIYGLGVVIDFEVVFLRGTTLVEVNLVKRHVFPSIVKVHPVGFHLYPISVNTLPEIYSRYKEEHANHLRIILELLKKEKLYAKLSKCDFWIHIVQFLGHLIDSQGLHVDPAKIEAVWI
ncbi:hypothetical protein Tco_0508498 [Tanacetum coccineum]